MAEGLFRKKSMDKVASPEQLNDYIRVSNPGVWMLLTGIIVLLIGICIWGVFGHLDTKLQTKVVCEDGIAICSMDEAQIEQITRGMTITVKDKQYAIETVSNETVSFACDLPDGTYDAEIIVESVTPISFVTN